ncbi:MAG: transposase [Gammaproteobacteria bacterium]|nr:transposase [Gammaproteobacteria bacterium]MYD00841.1 transposase [Gammaproteobacteria bacterium]MYI24936.1 transposase [Gammaproteobacteria bacterium]
MSEPININYSLRKDSAGDYVRGQIHTNGVESFWPMPKRAHNGIFRKISPERMQRCVNEFAGCHKLRELGTMAQMMFERPGCPGSGEPVFAAA